MKAETKQRVVKILDRISTILKCGGPGGTPGPCPSGISPIHVMGAVFQGMNAHNESMKGAVTKYEIHGKDPWGNTHHFRTFQKKDKSLYHQLSSNEDKEGRGTPKHIEHEEKLPTKWHQNAKMLIESHLKKYHNFEFGDALK